MNNLQEIIGNALKRGGKRQADLAETGIVSSPQAASRKMKANTWSVAELVAVAEWLGCKVIFQMQDGEQREINCDLRSKNEDA